MQSAGVSTHVEFKWQIGCSEQSQVDSVSRSRPITSAFLKPHSNRVPMAGTSHWPIATRSVMPAFVSLNDALQSESAALTEQSTEPSLWCAISEPAASRSISVMTPLHDPKLFML